VIEETATKYLEGFDFNETKEIFGIEILKKIIVFMGYFQVL